YKLTDGFFQLEGHTSDSYVRKSDGNYYLRVENENYNYEGYDVTVGALEYTILKDYLNEGDTWEEVLTVNYLYVLVGQEFEQTGSAVISNTILAKDVTVQVSGTTYTDVIKVKTTNATMLGQTQTEIWYSKGFGIIYHHAIGPGFINTNSLTSYTLN